MYRQLITWFMYLFQVCVLEGGGGGWGGGGGATEVFSLWTNIIRVFPQFVVNTNGKLPLLISMFDTQAQAGLW